MLIPTPHRILLAREPVDFRKQIDGLAAVCEQVLKEEPLDGTLFLFRNRRGNALKAVASQQVVYEAVGDLPVGRWSASF